MPASGARTVLVIDDDADSLLAMRAALAGETYRLETVDTAESAIRELSPIYPDLILLDSHVSTSDGTRLATRLLADEELAAVPIVALTATGAGRHDNQSDGRLCVW